MLPFAIALFLSASLLFMVQPMAAKKLLPLLGGTPAVWTACMLFFQALLLAGYAYAHAIVPRLALRRQVLLHAAVLALPFVVFATGAPSWRPPSTGSPLLWLLGMLALSVGLPFFALSTSASLLQGWFSRTGHADSRDPYFLYAVSNLGSLLGLLAYPFVMEALLDLDGQRALWIGGYAAFFAATGACFLRTWKAPDAARSEPSPESPTRWRERLMWIALAAAPSSLLLGMTSHVTTDLAPVPLLWVVPLALYLLSFVAAFARRPPLSRPVAAWVQLFLLVPLAIAIPWESEDPNLVFTLALPLHFVAFAATALVCHGELAARRPPAGRLTDFYLCMAAGGVLGGAFNAVAAPLLFVVPVEYPLILIAACLLRPRPARTVKEPLRWLLGLPAGFLAIGGVWLFQQWLGEQEEKSELACLFTLVGASVVVAPLLRGPAWHAAAGVGATLVIGAFATSRGADVLHQDRSFFGSHHVELGSDGRRQLVHGTTLHGSQNQDPDGRRKPLTYYHRGGPCGAIFGTFGENIPRRRVGVVGLGTGALAAYAQPGERWTFYEIDPAMERTAREWFTYLEDCRGDVDVVLGDGRLGVERASKGEFGLILLDAFSSDSIPVHLLTREAIRLYFDRLAEGGLLAVHVSNRFVDLPRLLSGHAADSGLTALLMDEPGRSEEQENEDGGYSSTWVVLARRSEDLRLLPDDPRWELLPADPTAPVWTDTFSNILSVFKFPWR